MTTSCPRRRYAVGAARVAVAALVLTLAGAGHTAAAARSRPAGASRPAVQVPAWIDATCTRNAAPALNRWIRTVPRGRTIVFRSGSCLLLAGSHGIDLSGRSDLVLKGAGTRIRLRTDGASNFSSAFFLQDSVDIVVQGFRVDGGNASTGSSGAQEVIDEHLNGAVIRAGSERVRFTRMRWDRLYGFGVFISDDGRAGDWPSRVTVSDSLIRGGEMGVAITAGRHLRILRNRIVDSVFIAVDLEPDRPHHGFEDVLIEGNRIHRYGWGPDLTSWFVAANPADAVVDTVSMDGLRIIGNRVERGPARSDNGNADGIGGLGIRADKANVKRGVVIRDNVSVDDDIQSSGRYVIYLANVENLTVTGNRQPIAGGAKLVSDRGTTGIRDIRGNQTRP